MIPDREQIRAFEVKLDTAFASRPLLRCDANKALRLAANVAEDCAGRNDAGWNSTLRHGIDAFASYLVSGASGNSPKLETLIGDLVFGARYHSLRELLYYSYNAPGSIDWTIATNRIELRYADRSLPRQFFTAFNEPMVGSISHFQSTDPVDPIIELLRTLPEFEYTEEHGAIEPFLERAADDKLVMYFNLLGSDSSVDLGGYTWSEAFSLYRALMIKALYHRYHGMAHDNYGCVIAPYRALIADLVKDLKMPTGKVEAILSDMIFDNDRLGTRSDATYFELYREGSGDRNVIICPHGFSLGEGLVQLLRVVAHRRPRTFLGKISNPLGRAFVARSARAFEAQGFQCHTEISMRSIDPTLPDIDLLVISDEPTLGFVLLVCELKSPVPPMWAKDQLRALASDNISKAFRQAEALGKFLGTPEGVRFLQKLTPSDRLPHLDGHVVLVSQLVISSDNAGMFFEKENVPIFSFRTVERLLQRSDGDIAFVLNGIRNYRTEADACYTTPFTEMTLDGLEIAYEGVKVDTLYEFGQNRWRSDGTRERVIAGFFKDGGHPFDALDGKVAEPVRGMNAFWLRSANDSED